jgi:hypothetical protein
MDGLVVVVVVVGCLGICLEAALWIGEMFTGSIRNQRPARAALCFQVEF